MTLNSILLPDACLSRIAENDTVTHFVSVPSDCSAYAVCEHPGLGVIPALMNCPAGLLFDDSLEPTILTCNRPGSVTCVSSVGKNTPVHHAVTSLFCQNFPGPSYASISSFAGVQHISQCPIKTLLRWYYFYLFNIYCFVLAVLKSISSIWSLNTRIVTVAWRTLTDPEVFHQCDHW